jgi:hypothetical protein
MRNIPWSIPVGLVASLGLLAGVASPAAAVTCTDRVVQARGEPSRFEALAKAKARGNWRAQVRALPALGAPYANWSIALSADYNCSQADDGYVCTAIARPCRE